MSSRIIIKNLPKYTTQDQLKDHFASQGSVTDVKLVSTPDGISRRFGYIGFKTNQQAQNAIKYFNRTYMDTCRIEVEEAFSIGSNALARPWSKYSEGSSGHLKITEKKDAKIAELEKIKTEKEKKPLNAAQKQFLEDVGADTY